MKNNFESCPFCESTDIYAFFYDPYDGYQGDCGSHIVRCRCCGAEIRARSLNEATKKWNRRPGTVTPENVENRVHISASSISDCEI